MGKNKHARFTENATFTNLHQPPFEDIFTKDYLLKGQWNAQVFHNNNPIVLELGCGRGEYTVGLSRRYTEKNFIGIDIKGARLWRGAKTATEEPLLNAAFIRTRIEYIRSFFAAGEVSEIWITFPDPQQKKQRANKRLTSARFLNSYKQFLKPDGIVHLKTDSRFLYEYTKALLEYNGLEILESATDLYADREDDPVLSIRTHYESIFLEQGIKITYLKFRLKSDGEIKELADFDYDDGRG